MAKLILRKKIWDETTEQAEQIKNTVDDLPPVDGAVEETVR